LFIEWFITVTNECPANHSCSQLCSVDPGSGMELCSCNRGYVLGNDNTSCMGESLYCNSVRNNLHTDIDECENDETCGQNCTNTIGAFMCSCNSGFALNDDRRTCDGK